MSSVLRFWVVVRDGRGKWVTVYDPKYEIKEDGPVERFAFETTAIEYQKKMEKRDKLESEREASRQASLLGEVQGE